MPIITVGFGKAGTAQSDGIRARRPRSRPGCDSQDRAVKW